MKIKDADYTNDQLFDQPESGLIKQVFTQYRTVERGVSVITTTRVYYPNNDYFDSHSVELLATDATK